MRGRFDPFRSPYRTRRARRAGTDGAARQPPFLRSLPQSKDEGTARFLYRGDMRSRKHSSRSTFSRVPAGSDPLNRSRSRGSLLIVYYIVSAGKSKDFKGIRAGFDKEPDAEKTSSARSASHRRGFRVRMKNQGTGIGKRFLQGSASGTGAVCSAASALGRVSSTGSSGLHSGSIT